MKVLIDKAILLYSKKFPPAFICKYHINYSEKVLRPIKQTF